MRIKREGDKMGRWEGNREGVVEERRRGGEGRVGKEEGEVSKSQCYGARTAGQCQGPRGGTKRARGLDRPLNGRTLNMSKL